MFTSCHNLATSLCQCQWLLLYVDMSSGWLTPCANNVFVLLRAIMQDGGDSLQVVQTITLVLATEPLPLAPAGQFVH
jgi:hypothetical protein